MTLADMPDLDGVYSLILETTDANKCLVDIPNIHDGNGALIMPGEYNKKLHHGMVVMVNVYMKMCATFVQNDLQC